MQNLKFQFKIQNYFTFFILLYFIILPRQIQAQDNLLKDGSHPVAVISSDQSNESPSATSTIDQKQLIELSEPMETVDESPKTILIIDEATAKAGYPAQSPDKNLTLVLYPNVLTSNLKVEVAEKDNSSNLPPNVHLQSKIYTFKLSQNNEPIILRKFFPLVLKLQEQETASSSEREIKEQNSRKALYSFLASQSKWIALKSKITKNTAIAQIDFSQATIAIFSAKEHHSLSPEIKITATEEEIEQSSITKDVQAQNKQDAATNLNLKSQSIKQQEEVQEQFTLYLGDDIIKKGYTVMYPRPNNDSNIESADEQTIEFKIAVLPKILTKSINLQIKKYPQNNFSDLPVVSEATLNGENYQISTDIYEYTFYDALVELEKDKKLILEINSLPPNQFNKKSIFFLDETINKWRPLPSYYNSKQNSIRTFTYFPYSKVAVFKNNNIKIGQASWFADRLSSAVLGAASNDFPLDTVLKVKNLANNKSVVAKAVSIGPFVDGRIIDLTYSAFSAIANPKIGVIEVEVEQIDSTSHFKS